jgi:hypothetical protein
MPDSKMVEAGIEQQVLSLLRGGQKIAAIKLYRDKTGVGLAEAKGAVESLAAVHGIAAPKNGCAGTALSLCLLAWYVIGVISRT